MTISTQRLRFLRGNSTAAGAFTGLQGELIFDTTLYTLRLQDGVTPGGYTLARASDVANVAANANYGNTNVAAYLTSYSGNLSAGNIFSNNYLYANGVSILTGIQSNYGNSNVATYLTSYSGNLSAGNVLSNNYLYVNGVSILTGIQSNYGNSNVAAYLVTYSGNLTAASIVSGNILPSANITYSLGNATAQWKDLWLSNNTLYLDSIPITVANGALSVNGSVISSNSAQLSRNGYVVSLEEDGDVVFPANIVSGEGGLANFIDLHAAALGDMSINGVAAMQINTDYYGIVKTWNFDSFGNLTLPSNIAAINYANGVSILNGITVSGSNYSNSNVAAYLPTYTGNLVSLTGDVTTTANVAGSYFIGNGAALTSLTGANVTGTVPFATTSQFVTGLTSANVTTALGYVPLDSNNANTYGNTNVASYLETYTGNIAANNINANIGTFNTIYGVIGTASQTGITTLGTLTSLAVTGTTSTGALQVDGNATIGNLLVTGTSTIIGNINMISGNSGQFFGNSPTGFNALYTGIAAGYTALQQTIIQSSGNYNDYAQINLENVNSGNAATGDYIVTADNGTDSTYYVDMGIASSNFDGLSPNIVGNSVRANDAYLYTLGNGAGNQGGNLIIGAGTSGKIIKLIAGGGNSNNVVATVAAGEFVVSGNISGTYLLGDGSQLTGLPATYANSNVASYLPTYTGNISAANISLTNNTSALTFNTGAYIFGDTVSRPGSITLQPNTSVAGFPSVVIGGVGRLAAPNGSVHAIFNTADLTVQVPLKITSGTISTSTTSGALQVTGGAGLTGNLYAGGAVVATGNVTGNFFIGNGALLTGISASSNYGNTNVAAYLASNSAVPIVTTSNVTGNFFIGNGSLLTGIVANTTYSNTNVASYLTGNIVVGNISGNEPNVTLVANTYSYVFSNIGNVSFPGNLSVTANTSVGNIFATGYYYANGAAFTGTGGSSNYGDSNVVTLLGALGSNSISTTGNLTAGYFIGNGALLTGIAASSNYGNTNVAAYLPTYTGNINAAYYFGNGSQLTSVAAVTATTATYVTGLTGTNVNVALGYIPLNSNGTAVTATTAQYVTELTSANVTTALGYTPTNYSNTNVAAYLTTYGGPINANIITGTANATVNELSVNNSVTIGTTLGVTGNITGSYFIGNGALLTGITATANYNDSNVATFLAALGSNAISTTGNIAAGNLNITGNIVDTGALSIISGSNGNISLIPNGTGITAVTGALTATGNVTGNFFIGNGALLTGIVASGSTYSNANVVSMLAANTAVYLGNVVTTYPTASNVTTLFIGNNTTITAGGASNSASYIMNNLYFQANGQLMARNTYGSGAGQFNIDGSNFNWLSVTSSTANTAVSLTSRMQLTSTALTTLSNVAITSAGTLTVQGTGGLVTSQTTANLFNTVATNINFGNVATVISMGANSAAVSIGNSSGNLSVGNITTSSNITVNNTITTGSLTLAAAGTGNISGVGNIVGTTANTTITAGTYVTSFLSNGAVTTTSNVIVTGPNAISIPNLPAFRVYGTSSSNIFAGNTVTGTQGATIDYNQGSYYNNTTGIFTAPVAGLYHAYATLRVGGNNGLNQASLQKNSSTSGANVIAFWETDTNTGTASHFSMTGYAKCVAGDTIRLQVITGQVQFDANDSWGVTFIG